MADKWEWQEELAKAHLTQLEVANFIGLDKGRMSALVKKMIIGEGKTASELDYQRSQKRKKLGQKNLFQLLFAKNVLIISMKV